jgi:signal transduction histidine kinase
MISNLYHMVGLTDNLLDRSRIEAGTLRFTVESFAPALLASEVVAAMQPLARTKGVMLEWQAEPGLPEEVEGDRGRIRQILVHLVGNGIKLTEEGRVSLCMAAPDEGHWSFEVSDTGRGIPPVHQRTLFEPFHRSDSGRTREYRGLGLGLSIIRALVEAMGGDMAMQSESGMGSTFTVVLPLVADPAHVHVDRSG